MRAVVLALCLSLPLSGAAQTPESLSMPATDPATALTLWIDGFRPRAEAEGISPNTMEAAFAGLTYLPIVVERDRNQNEFTKTLWDYLSTAVSEGRIRNGQARLAEHAGLLAEIEARYRVDRHVVAAIWGLESAYGAVRGDTPTISALATLASDGRRGAFFERQLLGALTILQNGDVAAGDMRGSWAGAMGHTQFMPTSFLDLAQDFRGDGRRDIWSDDPTDALASTAHYLQSAGWVEGQPWGVEVRLPEGFDYTLADRTVRKMPGAWAEIGVLDRTGAPVPNHGLASILLPAGAKGAAFMIFDNFAAIERYNTADSYVIAVGHLADRLRGGAPIEAEWPFEDRALTFAERKELQERLTEAGFSTQGVDGLIGPNTVDAIRAWQLANGLTPDGYAPPSLLERLR
ncbi:MAG: lytic murein transglycosylase [Flavimaricola sp.]|nr:lytic murein transglycosylase [Flavimaricola sp.]